MEPKQNPEKIIGKISADVFKRLQEQNILTIKAAGGNEGNGGIIKVKSNCPIKFVNNGGVLQVQVKENTATSSKDQSKKPSQSACSSPVITDAKVSNPTQIYRVKTQKSIKKPKQVEVIQKKRTPDPTFFRVSQHLQQFYPELQVRKLIWGNYSQSTAMEITRKTADLGMENSVPLTVARVVFYPNSWKVELRVHGVLDALVSRNVGRLGDIDFSELGDILRKLGPRYHYCTGISSLELEKMCPTRTQENVAPNLAFGNDGYRAAVCQRWFDGDSIPESDSEDVFNPAVMKCPTCIDALQKAIIQNEDASCDENEGKNEEEDVCLEMLSEEELRIRCEALQRETKLLSGRMHRAEIKLPKEAEIVARINADRKAIGTTNMTEGNVQNRISKKLIKHYEAIDRVLKMIDEGVKFHDKAEAIQTLRIKDTLIKSRLKSEIRCSICYREFENPLLFVKHKLSHKRDYKCLVCAKLFYTKQALKSHEATHCTERPFKCICGKTFRTNRHLVVHQQSHSTDRPFKCGQCSKAFRQKRQLKGHMASHGEKGDLVCEHCNKVFGFKSTLQSHLLIHAGKKPFACRHCDQRFRQTGHLKAHLGRKHPEDPGGRMYFRCWKCPKSFALESERNEHQAQHDPADKNLSCRVCEEKFHNRGSLRMHEAGHGIIKARHANSIDSNGGICETCGKTFSSVSSLKVHQRIHSGARPYKCEICEKRFIQKCYLKIHRRCHTGLRPYKCKTCHKQFAQSCSLKVHEFQHKVVRPYVCEVCGKSYSVRSTLRTHMALHSDERPLACSYCPKRFRQLGTLMTHENTHTRKQVFTCDQCGKEFLQKTDMIKHRRIHTGEKPFKCKECGRGFAQQSSLQSHRRTHDIVGRFECDVCSKRFRHKVTLRNHLRSFHGL